MISGYICDKIGYQHFFIMVLICTIPALLITWFVPFSYPDTTEKAKNEATT